MSRAIVIITDGAGTEFIGSCEYAEGRMVLDGDGYAVLHDPLRLTVASDGANFRTIMTPPGSFDWCARRRIRPEGVEEAGPIAAARYAKNVAEYRKQYETETKPQPDGVVKTPKLIIGGKS